MFKSPPDQSLEQPERALVEGRLGRPIVAGLRKTTPTGLLACSGAYGQARKGGGHDLCGNTCEIVMNRKKVCKAPNAKRKALRGTSEAPARHPRSTREASRGSREAPRDETPARHREAPARHPRGTARHPRGTARHREAPRGTREAPRGTARHPRGTARHPRGTARHPRGTARHLRGTARHPRGAARHLKGTASHQRGSDDTMWAS